MEQLIQAYGAWMVLFGSALEGETVVLLGGFAAHRGYLTLGSVMLAAFAGAVLGDQIAFHAGRWRGVQILEHRPGWAARVEPVRDRVDRLGPRLVFIFRFLFGLRVVLPFLWGMGSMSSLRFLVVDALGAAIWSLAVSAAGFLLGSAAQTLLGDVESYERDLFLFIVIAGVVVWGLRYWRSRARVG